ncbi:helix-turn-helix domain-containing protein [Pedobacter sp. MW01-1-1]|uniref:helix-turn-helix domain-containing protein n=1 Tax=Pedobacter sp. MW01-1-1 TaxID=3383027 RepID=UPI003FF14814
MPVNKQELVKKVGLNIRTCRKEKNISMERLALDTGLDYSQICRIERGVINTSLYQIYLISKYLDVPVIHFFSDI